MVQWQKWSLPIPIWKQSCLDLPSELAHELNSGATRRAASYDILFL